MVVWDPLKTTIDISDSLFEDAKSVAASRGISFRHLVEEGLRTMIQHEYPKKQFRLRDGSFGEAAREGSPSWTAVRKLIYKGRGE